jgi:outer membrane receptor protein involved in Fe transport
VGILSGGYKNLNDFIYTFSRRNYTANDFAHDFAGQSNPIPAGESNWKFTQQRNGDNVDIYGFEVALQRQLDLFPEHSERIGSVCKLYLYEIQSERNQK